ncbi:hypothetical protein D3C87_1679190 [compost metagenome]
MHDAGGDRLAVIGRTLDCIRKAGQRGIAQTFRDNIIPQIASHEKSSDISGGDTGRQT